MPVLVLGGTGTVGSQVVRELLGRGADVRVLTRSADKSKQLPDGARGIVGDLLDPTTIKTAFRGMDAVFLLNPVSATESHEGLMALNGARLGGVGRLVYLSVHQASNAPHLPHFGSKVGIERAIEHTGIPYTILAPNNYYQNDQFFRDAILQHGIYPQPLGDRGVSRVDVRDIAEAAAIALLEAGHDGQTYNLVGPQAVTGESTAATWSRVLGRPVRYAGNDLEVWEQQSLQYLPAGMVFDFKLMYHFFQTEGFHATDGDIRRQTALLGHPPRDFETFASETAAAWVR